MHVRDTTPRQLRWYLRPFFWLQRRRYGAPLVPAMIWARVPPLYFALAGFYAALDRKRSPLDPALRSLVQTRISQLNHCTFCVDLNSAISARRSGSLDKALAVGGWRDHPGFSELERLALDYAETITGSDLRVSDEQVRRLREHLDENGLIELTALIAFQNLSAKFNAALDVPPQGICPMPTARE